MTGFVEVNAMSNDRTHSKKMLINTEQILAVSTHEGKGPVVETCMMLTGFDSDVHVLESYEVVSQRLASAGCKLVQVADA